MLRAGILNALWKWRIVNVHARIENQTSAEPEVVAQAVAVLEVEHETSKTTLQRHGLHTAAEVFALLSVSVRTSCGQVGVSLVSQVHFACSSTVLPHILSLAAPQPAGQTSFPASSVNN